MALIKCPECGKEISDKSENCIGCGYPIQGHSRKREDIETCIKSQNCEEKRTFNGIYKYTFFGGKQEVYCPRCGSENCSHYQEQKIIPGKTKTRYTANLNPLRPFTLLNKKEKVIRKEEIMTESKFLCNDCGKIFR